MKMTLGQFIEGKKKDLEVFRLEWLNLRMGPAGNLFSAEQSLEAWEDDFKYYTDANNNGPQD